MPKLLTVGDKLHWSYANLAMAHSALTKGSDRYSTVHFMVRARLFKGLQTGTMSLGSFADDERLKMILPQACGYCGSDAKLSIDHLISKKLGGADTGDNLVWACRSCNSSKGAMDLLVWYRSRGIDYPPVLLLRRYLKLLIDWCERSGKNTLPMDPMPTDLLFALDLVPRNPPPPGELTLWAMPLESSTADVETTTSIDRRGSRR